MENDQYQKLAAHIGHRIAVVSYAEGENVAVECEDCHEVLADENRESEEPTYYGTVEWSVEDVQTAREDLSDEDAEAFLQRAENQLRDRLIEVGWDVMGTLLDMDDELPPKPEKDEDE